MSSDKRILIAGSRLVLAAVCAFEFGSSREDTTNKLEGEPDVQLAAPDALTSTAAKDTAGLH